MCHPLVIRIAAAIMSVAAVSVADAAPQFAATPKAVDDIKRGVENGLTCALANMRSAQISNCSFAMARANAQRTSDTRAYNVGLSFETWRDLDVDWFSDQKLLKSGQVTASQLHDEETGVRAMYQLYKSARDALGISDKDLVALMTKMTPQGRAATWERLQFWAKQAH